MNTSIAALGYVDNDHAPVYGLLKSLDEPRVIRAVTGPEGFEYDSPETGGSQHMFHSRLLYARKQIQIYHIWVHAIMHFERSGHLTPPKSLLVVVYPESHTRKFRIIIGFEGIELIGTMLCAPVATPQIVLKKYRHFTHYRRSVKIFCSSHLQSRDEIFLTVSPHFSYRKLRTRDNHRLVKILKHKRQCRGCVGHSVGAVKNHKTFIAVIIVLNDMGNIAPMRSVHGTGIDRTRKLHVVNLEIQHLDFWDIVDKMVEIERFECSCIGVLDHSNRTSCINHQYAGALS